MKKIILLSAVIAMFSQSCKDKDNEPGPTKALLSARQQALIGKDWKLKSVTVSGQDLTGLTPPCIMDNIFYHFKDANNGYIDEGASKCDQADSQRFVFKWKLTNSENTLIVNYTDENDTFNIVSVSSSEFKISDEETVITLKNP